MMTKEEILFMNMIVKHIRIIDAIKFKKREHDQYKEPPAVGFRRNTCKRLPVEPASKMIPYLQVSSFPVEDELNHLHINRER